MSNIFISYRRDDSAPTAGRIYDRLIAHFGKDAVFKDVDNIPYGENFPRFIRGIIAECSVMLAIIGPRWLDAETADGKRQLDDPKDWVRIEIEMALSLGLTVIPLLVVGARMPKAASLPESLHELAEINSLAVRNDPDFNGDMYRLQTTLERWLPSVPAPQGRAGSSYGKAPAPQYPNIGSRQPQSAMPAAALAPPRVLEARYGLSVGAIAGVVPALLNPALLHALFISYGIVTNELFIILSTGWLITGLLATGVAGFLGAKRNGLLRSGLIAGLATGFVIWLAAVVVNAFFLVQSAVIPVYNYGLDMSWAAFILDSIQSFIEILVVSLVTSSVGGVIGRSELQIRYACLIGAITSAAPALLFLVVFPSLPDAFIGPPLPLTGALILAILAFPISGFLGAKRGGLLRFGLIAGLVAGFVIWLGLAVGAALFDIIVRNGQPLSGENAIGWSGILLVCLVAGLGTSSFGGLIGRAVARRQRMRVPVAEPQRVQGM